jgi:hypothetical protein
MAAASTNKEDKLVGLDLIARLGAPTAELREQVISILEKAKDEDILQGAYYAMGTVEGNNDDKSRIAQCAKRDAQKDRQELKRRALSALASNLDDQEGFDILLAALNSPSKVIIAEAMKGISKHASFADEGVADKFLELLALHGADKHLRRSALSALDSLSLSAVQKKRRDELERTDASR